MRWYSAHHYQAQASTEVSLKSQNKSTDCCANPVKPLASKPCFCRRVSIAIDVPSSHFSLFDTTLVSREVTYYDNDGICVWLWSWTRRHAGHCYSWTSFDESHWEPARWAARRGTFLGFPRWAKCYQLFTSGRLHRSVNGKPPVKTL